MSTVLKSSVPYAAPPTAASAPLQTRTQCFEIRLQASQKDPMFLWLKESCAKHCHRIWSEVWLGITVTHTQREREREILTNQRKRLIFSLFESKLFANDMCILKFPVIITNQTKFAIDRHFHTSLGHSWTISQSKRRNTVHWNLNLTSANVRQNDHTYFSNQASDIKDGTKRATNCKSTTSQPGQSAQRTLFFFCCGACAPGFCSFLAFLIPIAFAEPDKTIKTFPLDKKLSRNAVHDAIWLILCLSIGWFCASFHCWSRLVWGQDNMLPVLWLKAEAWLTRSRGKRAARSAAGAGAAFCDHDAGSCVLADALYDAEMAPLPSSLPKKRGTHISENPFGNLCCVHHLQSSPFFHQARHLDLRSRFVRLPFHRLTSPVYLHDRD